MTAQSKEKTVKPGQAFRNAPQGFGTYARYGRIDDANTET
jgi:hypothetical protein